MKTSCKHCRAPIEFKVEKTPGYKPRTGWSDGHPNYPFYCGSARDLNHEPDVETFPNGGDHFGVHIGRDKIGSVWNKDEEIWIAYTVVGIRVDPHDYLRAGDAVDSVIKQAEKDARKQLEEST